MRMVASGQRESEEQLLEKWHGLHPDETLAYTL
jgi:hypothetical protein